MPIFQLTEEIVFPPPRLASEAGLLAVGGDLAPERLLLAYRNGIFPWYNEEEPILWWSPDPRFVLFPDRMKISRSLRGLLKKNLFTVTFDTSFREVVAACQEARRGQEEGTWITAAMAAAYIRLHEFGWAHSVEAWRDKTLVGGLYGVSLGKCFFGESMFTRVPNASKVALITLVENLRRYDFRLIDCQVYTDHLRSLGAEMMFREDFQQVLKRALDFDTRRGKWRLPVKDGIRDGVCLPSLSAFPVAPPILAGDRRRGGSPYFVHHNKSLSS
jgi:leucyl/phenylalanyl-tRNA---protein transferase